MENVGQIGCHIGQATILFRQIRSPFSFQEQKHSEGVKATSYLTIFMPELRAKNKIQRNNYKDVQCGLSFAGKTSSVSLIARSTHAQRIAE